MSFMKNKLSYALWAAFAAFTGLAYVVFLILGSGKIITGDNYIQIALFAAPVLLAVGLFFLIRFFVKVFMDSPMAFFEGKGAIFRILLLILLTAAAGYLRYLSFDTATESAAYYEVARINGNAIPMVAHAGQALYVYLLRGLFFVVGNHFAAGIILQIVLQVLGAYLWYFALQKLIGNTAAVLFFASVMLSPYFVKESLTYSPNVLFFVIYGFGLLCIGFYYKHLRHVSSLSTSDSVWSFFMGVMVSIISFFDAIGLSLFVVLYFVRHIRNKQEDKSHSIHEELAHSISMLFGLHLMGYFVGYLIIMLLDATVSNSNVQMIMSVGVEMFAPKTELDLLSPIRMMDSTQIIIGIALCAVLMMGLPAFWLRRDRENQLLWFSMFAAIVLFYGFGANTNAMHYEFMVVLAAFVLVLSGLQGILVVPDEADGDKLVITRRERRPREKRKKEPAGKAPAKTAQESGRSSADYYKPQAGVNYIENPLPLPKKTARKSQGYRYEISEDRMHYDIAVRDNDDFDI